MITSSKSLKCEICKVKYDQNEHLPKFFPTCGHTICASCLAGILDTKGVCPFDRTKFDKTLDSVDKFTTNLFVIQQLTEQSQLEKFTICPRHQSKQKFVCLVDHAVICKYCESLGEHKGHNKAHIGDIKTQALEKQKTLEHIINHNIDKDYKEAQKVLRKGRQTMKDDIVKRINEISDWVDKQQERIVKKIENIIEEEKQQKPKNEDSNEKVKEEIKAQIEALEKMDYSQDFFNALKSNIIEKALEQCTNQTDAEEMSEIEKTIKTCINHFDQKLSLIIQEYQPSLKNEEIFSQISQNEEEIHVQKIEPRPELDWEALADC